MIIAKRLRGKAIATWLRASASVRMQLKYAVLLALVACKGSTGKPTTPEEARKLATDLAAAIGTCDRAAIAKLVDPAVLAERAGGDGAFAAIAVAEWNAAGPCHKSDDKRTRFALVADPTKAALRFEIRPNDRDLVERVGYIVLVAETPAHVVDLRAPLVPETIVERLKWNADTPRGDHFGRVADTFYLAFEGVETAGFTLLEHFDAEVDAKPPANDDQLGRRIEYGSRAWNSLAVEQAVTKIEALVGRDPYLENLVAAVHRPEPAQMLERARKTTSEHPALADAWITQLYAEALSGDFEAAMTSLDTLVTQFSFDWRPLGKQLALARFTASPAFAQKYPL